MFSSYAPLLSTYWSQLVALLVGFFISAVFQQRIKYDGATGAAKRPSKSETAVSDIDNGGVRTTSVGRLGKTVDEEVDSEVDDLRQARLESCEPSKDEDYENKDDAFDDANWEDSASGGRHVPYSLPRLPDEEMIRRSVDFYQEMNRRRSVRFYSEEPIPRAVIDNLIKTAGTSPSGAHTEPWTFVVVRDRELKTQIRLIVEAEERVNYEKRMGQRWLADLQSINTTWEKPYLERAPCLIIVFKQTHGCHENGQRKTHYYHEISTSISVGLLLAAIQNVGLVSLTSTPMNAGPKLRSLLNRPANEKVLLLLPVGFPAKDATVPDFKRKPLDQIRVDK